MRSKPLFCVPIARTSSDIHPTLQAAANSLTLLSERISTGRCPFWRKRCFDAVDAVWRCLRWTISRHASLKLPMIPTRTARVVFGPPMSLEMRLVRLREDFTERQYYITGFGITSCLYHPLCVFLGPDPDTPVHGVTRWKNATSGLFRASKSKIDLISIGIVDENTIQARWRLEGELALPFHAKIKPYTGMTTYHFDEQGLIYRHEEQWDLSAFDAFVSVVIPSFGVPPAPQVHEL